MPQRIGLLTLPLEVNYGGILQAVALHQFLASHQEREVVLMEREPPLPRWMQRRGAVFALRHCPEVSWLYRGLSAAPDDRGGLARLRSSAFIGKIRTKIGRLLWLRRRERFRAFHRRLIPCRSGILASSAEMAGAVRAFDVDVIIVGSDQVWRLDYLAGEDAKGDYFIGFSGSEAVRKISYAASFGHGRWIYDGYTEQTKNLLARFDAVSVREDSGVEICQKVLQRNDVRHVLDPTLLVDAAFYDTIAAPPTAGSVPVLLSYVLDESSNRDAVCRELQSALGSGHVLRALSLDVGSATVDVPGWLRAFMDADFVVTDSFHGVAFSIIFRKNFIAIMNSGRGAARFTSLLGQLGLMDRLVSDPAPETLRRLAQASIDYGPVGARLDELRAASADFLKRALA